MNGICLVRKSAELCCLVYILYTYVRADKLFSVPFISNLQAILSRNYQAEFHENCGDAAHGQTESIVSDPDHFI